LLLVVRIAELARIGALAGRFTSMKPTSEL
jgi:hypothetical protein